MDNLLVVKDDGTITIDTGADGEVDIVSGYTIDGDEVTVHAADTVTLTAIDDPCEAVSRVRRPSCRW